MIEKYKTTKAAQAEIEQLKAWRSKDQTAIETKDHAIVKLQAEISRLKDELKEVTAKHLSLGLTCDRLSDEKLLMKKRLDVALLQRERVAKWSNGLAIYKLHEQELDAEVWNVK